MRNVPKENVLIKVCEETDGEVKVVFFSLFLPRT